MKTKYVGIRKIQKKKVEFLDKLLFDIMFRLNGLEKVAKEVSEHLVSSSLYGVDSHGIWRILQYADYYKSGFLKKNVLPVITKNKKSIAIVNGLEGIGIPAMNLASDYSIDEAKKSGISIVGIINSGHTGRLGAYSEKAAQDNCLSIIVGGGGSKKWSLTTPYGGKEKRLSTNPYSIGIPGGKRGPVILDFATSAVAGGWVYSAKRLGLKLPKGILIDKNGDPTSDPKDYFKGGAILPAGGAKGYALSVVAELIAEAMLGPVTLECNWLMITVDTELFQEQSKFKSIAEDVLSDIRNCPPAKNFKKVEIPGEREREIAKVLSVSGISVPNDLLNQILELRRQFN